MAPNPRQSQSSGSNDLACAHCRERKIRCDRNKPACGNCRRDKIECSYSSPGKRVNHIKLLCDNVNGMEERLLHIQSALSNLQGDVARLGSRMSVDGDSARSSPRRMNPDPPSPPDPRRSHSDGPVTVTQSRHVCRSPHNTIERYHGPGSLVDLCSQFRRNVLESFAAGSIDSQLAHSSAVTPSADRVREILDHMCHVASVESSSVLRADPNLADLPSKELLSHAIDQFFEQLDCNTDIFNEAHFRARVEKLYRQSGDVNDPTAEVWAVCLKIIISLVLGAEILGHGNGSMVGGVARSFILSRRAALVNSSVIMAPRLINVQTMLLLSIDAQRFDGPGWSNMLFAQACMLARSLGIHHTGLTDDHLNAGEAEERSKVLRALYIRDKNLSVLRGAVSWIPSSDCAQFDTTSNNEPAYKGELQLAMVQDDVYSLIHSARSTGRLMRIEHELSDVAEKFDLPNPARQDAAHALLSLSFLATRINALGDSSPEIHSRTVLRDARACCLQLLTACGRRSELSAEQVKALWPHETAGRSHRPSTSGPQSASRISTAVSAQPVLADRQKLLAAFPAAALFVMARKILWATSPVDKREVEADTQLLQKVVACFKDYDTRYQTETYSHKLCCVLESLCWVVPAMRESRRSITPPPRPPPTAAQHQRNAAPPSLVFESSMETDDQEELDTTNAPDFSIWPTSMMMESWDPSLTNDNMFSEYDLFGSLPDMQDFNNAQFMDNEVSPKMMMMPNKPQQKQRTQLSEDYERSIENLLDSHVAGLTPNVVHA